ncbi:MAG TPA: hypothetical protein VFL17_12220 [Anaerolineae bacterium]|nr:hypothetical protein [Anaerolineae bacterium]
MTHVDLDPSSPTNKIARLLRLLLSIVLGLSICVAVVLVVDQADHTARAEPLPGGTPKLILSTKTVSPTITAPGSITLTYRILLANTGAWTATATLLRDALPTPTTYISGSARASAGTQPIVQNGVLTWTGNIGFDRAVEITFSARLTSAMTFGQVVNSAVVSNAQIATPITLTAVTTVTNVPILTIGKMSAPAKPGPNKPMVYTLTVANQGQDAANLPITVTDQVPQNTTVLDVGPNGIAGGNAITWTRPVTLALGETSTFTFSVTAGDVPSGTVISNSNYKVASPQTGVSAGKLYTVTIVDPIFSLSKETWPHPPGSNREMTYTLTLLNTGSQATGVVVTDRVPSGVTYVRGGALLAGVVSWTLPSLDTGAAAEFTYTVYISDVMDVPIVNDDYTACSAEGVCQAGDPLTITADGPNFEAVVVLDPIAKKPGAGTGPVTPTLVVRNLGPGNAIGAMATFYFENIAVSGNDLYGTPPVGTPPPFPPGPVCGTVDVHCDSFVWVGSLGYGQAVTFTTIEGQNTIGGDEGNLYTATVVVSDSLSNMTTSLITGTAAGRVTHFANLIPTKSALPVVGRGQLMTYTILVVNSGLAAELPPILTDTVPLSVSLVSISDGGVAQTKGVTPTRTVISWTLPALSPGDTAVRSFMVRVADNLVSGTQIVNQDYRVTWTETETSTLFSNAGQPVTTTVREVGLIDSYKEVTPTWALPGPNNVLTYSVHVVNSSAVSLTGVTLRDVLPWQFSTYQRDAVASAGSVVSDIVTVRWTGNVDAFSSQVVTFTVRVDPGYRGPVTNTATISHSSLLTPVVVQAVAYITDLPVLFISKSASPDPVAAGSDLNYTIRVVNAGQQATGLVITDVIPTNTTYVAGSASANGQLVGNQLRWEVPVLKSGESQALAFRVKVESGQEVVNRLYAVKSAEGITSLGAPVVTRVTRGNKIYLPIVMRNAP